jgi:hypothetical protein
MQAALDWLREARRQYGLFFLVLIFLVYWIQGIRTFAGTATFYVLKQEFDATPAVNQAVRVAVTQPWNIKWLYGIVSDNIPLFGYHVKPYLVVSSIFAAIGHVGLSTSSLSYSIFTYTLYYTILQFSAALADVLVDSLVVKVGRDAPNGSADLQSFSWIAFAIGGILGNLIGGPMVQFWNPRAFLVSLLGVPFIILYCAYKLPENRTDVVISWSTPVYQVRLLFGAFFAKPYLVLKSFGWVFMSNALGFSIEDGMTYFRVCKASFLFFLSPNS